MAKKNPLNLNALQLKTLTLFQALAELDGYREETADGEISITRLPHAHGDHFHLGPWVVLSRDATGLHNPAPWTALERKGLIKGSFPDELILTHAGRTYDTGLRETILHGSDH